MSNTSYFGTSLHKEEAIFKYRKYTAVARTANQAESRPPNHGQCYDWGNVQNTCHMQRKAFSMAATEVHLHTSIFWHFVRLLSSHKFMILDKNNFFHTIWGAIIHQSDGYQFQASVYFCHWAATHAGCWCQKAKAVIILAGPGDMNKQRLC